MEEVRAATADSLKKVTSDKIEHDLKHGKERMQQSIDREGDNNLS